MSTGGATLFRLSKWCAAMEYPLPPPRTSRIVHDHCLEHTGAGRVRLYLLRGGFGFLASPGGFATISGWSGSLLPVKFLLVMYPENSGETKELIGICQELRMDPHFLASPFLLSLRFSLAEERG